MNGARVSYVGGAAVRAPIQEWHVDDAPAAPPRTRAGTSALLYFLAILFPIHHEIAGVNVSLGDTIVGVLTIVLIFRFLTGHIPVPPFLLHLSALGLVVAISLLVHTVSPSPYFVFVDGAVEAVKLLGVVLWLFAIFWLLRTDLQRRFLKFAVTSVAVAVLWSLLTVKQNILGGVERPSGPFENANLYGNYLVLNVALAFGIGHLLEADWDGTVSGASRLLRRFRLPLLIGVQLTLLLGIFSTGSRGTLLAYATVVLVTFRLWRPRHISVGRVMVALFGAVLMAGALSWYFSQNPYLTKRLRRTNAAEHNVEERLELWRAARDAFYERPAMGIGWGQFRHYAGHTHHIVAKVTHQTYLSFAAELGIPGLLILLWMLGAAVIAAWRWRLTVGDGLSTMAMAFVLATGVQGFFNNVDQFRSLWIAIGLIAAIGVARRQEDAP